MTETTSNDVIEEKLARVASQMKADLEEHYSPITFEVHAALTPIEFGEIEDPSYIQMFIVVDGSMKDLLDRHRAGEIGRVRKFLSEVDIDEFPVLSFLTRAEWDQERKRLSRSKNE